MRTVCVAMVALLALFLQGIEGRIWKVGDSKGWHVNVDYGQWSQGKIFEVGDSLWFIYNKTNENVLEVSKSDYASCTTIDPIATYNDGNTTLLLTNDTTRFFISGFPGHCVQGMTLEIRIGSPAPSPSPSPSSSSKLPTPSPMQPLVPSASSSAPPPLQQAISSPPPLNSFAHRTVDKRGCLAASMAMLFGACLIL